MKQSEIIKILGQALGAQSLEEINKALKAKDYSTKFRLTGPAFVHFGFTGLIKALTPEGVKIFNVNKVNLVRFEDIETFAKAIPREERKGIRPDAVAKKKGPRAALNPKAKASHKNSAEEFDDEDDEDFENDDDFDAFADEEDDVIEDDSVSMKVETVKKKKPKKDELHVPGSGSRFIPKKK